MNLLVFDFQPPFAQNLRLVANNELDLREHLMNLGYNNIEFRDIDCYYGTCIFNDGYGTQEANCSYFKKI